MSLIRGSGTLTADHSQTGKIAIENQVSRIRGLSGGSGGSGDDVAITAKNNHIFQL